MENHTFEVLQNHHESSNLLNWPSPNCIIHHYTIAMFNNIQWPDGNHPSTKINKSVWGSSMTNCGGRRIASLEDRWSGAWETAQILPGVERFLGFQSHGGTPKFSWFLLGNIAVKSLKVYDAQLEGTSLFFMNQRTQWQFSMQTVSLPERMFSLDWPRFHLSTWQVTCCESMILVASAIYVGHGPRCSLLGHTIVSTAAEAVQTQRAVGVTPTFLRISKLVGGLEHFYFPIYWE